MRALCRAVFVAFAALLIAGCAMLPGFDPVRVTVAGVEPLASEGLEWRMLVKLRVQNPNETAIDYDGVSVKLEVLDHTFASGVSSAGGSIPRFGESVVGVPVTVSVVDIVSRAMRMTRETLPERMSYRLEGKLHGPRFGSARFESRGELALPRMGLPSTGAER